MDPFMVAAGSAVVGAMASEGWNDARTAIAALWRKAHPERVPAIEADLEEVRAEVLAARKAEDRQTEEELAVEWRRRLGRLIAADPKAAEELRRIVDGLTPPTGGAPTVMIANASGRARLFQSGGDINVRGR
ncbi:hypothetical protein ACFOY2_23075 [Nonomuraea purpurea]|uniref:Uncharacterized protein n=1 Tax=Nonomuraea purpurea TaxID=1849276 RepID=A0ABV8G828_9ACTN